MIKWAMPKLGRSAVNPLVIALQHCPALNIRLLVLDALAKIGYQGCLPYVREIIEDEDSSAELIDAAQATIAAVDRAGLSPASASAAFQKLGVDYYEHLPSLAVPANQELANVWFWDDDKGLFHEEVKRGAFDELMAMRCCENAIRLEPRLGEAISLWLAAFFRLEAEGYDQPGYFAEQHADAGTYALTAGPSHLQGVLTRALSRRERPVALGAIGAMRRNAGEQALLYSLDGRQPLVEALSYPDREVRFSAALAVANSLPAKQFKHGEHVVPILAEAMRQRGQRCALVIDEDQERRNRLVGELRGVQGYFEVANGDNFAVVLDKTRQLPSVDLVVVSADIRQPGLRGALALMKGNFRVAFCPTVVITAPAEVKDVNALAKDNPYIQAVPMTAEVGDIAAALAGILERNEAREFEAGLADQYAQDAAVAVNLLATTGNKIVDVKAAEAVLLEAVYEDRAAIQMYAIDSLARIDSADAQRAVAALALDEGVALQTRLRAFRGVAVSAKRYGQLLLSEQVRGIYDIVQSLKVDAELRNLAAEAYGALNLPSARVSDLIMSQAADAL